MRTLLDPHLRSYRASLGVTAMLSMTGGIVGHGIYFMAREAYHFSDTQNLLLAAALFTPYVPGALLAGPVASRLGSPRALALLSLVMIACGLVLATRPPVWALWLCAPLYNGCSGMCWPLLEAGVSRGRSGTDLQRAIGVFNLTWATTLAPALWVVAWAGERLEIAFGTLIGLHLLMLPLVAWVGGVSAPAPAEHSGPDYRPQLRVARLLMPLAYLFLDTLAPLLPGIWAALGLLGARGAALTPVWMIARVLVFAGMMRSRRWQGRWGTLIVGAVLLLAGMAAVLSGGSVATVVGGLVSFGLGHGMIYYAALYYGMATGHGEVEAGGWHEATIGMGYLAGPLLAVTAMQLGTSPLPVVATVGAVGMALAARMGWKASSVPAEDRAPH